MDHVEFAYDLNTDMVGMPTTPGKNHGLTYALGVDCREICSGGYSWRWSVAKYECFGSSAEDQNAVRKYSAGLWGIWR